MAALHIQSRLRRLETRLSDGSGLRPRSREWLEHWARRLQRMFSGEEPGGPGCIPLEVWDAIDVAGQDGATGSQNLAQVVCVGHPPGTEVATDNA